jgi:hypothetical protein
MLSDRLRDGIANDPRLGEIVKDVTQELLSDTNRSLPVYRHDIKTEAQADTARDLPLLYIWNETLVGGRLAGFSLSTSGEIVGGALEHFQDD